MRWPSRERGESAARGCVGWTARAEGAALGNGQPSAAGWQTKPPRPRMVRLRFRCPPWTEIVTPGTPRPVWNGIDYWTFFSCPAAAAHGRTVYSVPPPAQSLICGPRAGAAQRANGRAGAGGVRMRREQTLSGGSLPACMACAWAQGPRSSLCLYLCFVPAPRLLLRVPAVACCRAPRAVCPSATLLSLVCVLA